MNEFDKEKAGDKHRDDDEGADASEDIEEGDDRFTIDSCGGPSWRMSAGDVGDEDVLATLILGDDTNWNGSNGTVARLGKAEADEDEDDGSIFDRTSWSRNGDIDDEGDMEFEESIKADAVVGADREEEAPDGVDEQLSTTAAVAGALAFLITLWIFAVDGVEGDECNDIVGTRWADQRTRLRMRLVGIWIESPMEDEGEDAAVVVEMLIEDVCGDVDDNIAAGIEMVGGADKKLVETDDDAVGFELSISP